MKAFPLPLLYILIIFFGFTSNGMAGTIKCWKNSQGFRECGHTVPPEFSQSRIEVLNEQGQIIKIYERAKTPEEQKEAKRLAEIEKEKERQRAEQKRRDLILLKTFSNERDIRISYDDKIQALNSIVKLTEANNKNLLEKLSAVQKQLADYERAGETPPDNLFKSMSNLKSRINDNEKKVASQKKEIEVTKEDFQTDLERFRLLKGYQVKQ